MLRSSTETSGSAHGRKDCGNCRIAFGRIDVLVNNAGVFIPKPFTEYTTEDFKHSSLDNACRFFVRVAARGKANAAAEVRQHRQHLNDPG